MKKLDLNQGKRADFMSLWGFFPGLGSMILNNRPYHCVEDVLKIPFMSNKLKDLLRSQLHRFSICDDTVMAK